MNKQIAELVEEGHHDDIRIEMSDKKMYFILREYWMELTDIWEPGSGFMSTQDRKSSLIQALHDRTTGQTVSNVPVGKVAFKMAMIKVRSLYKLEEKVHKKLHGWAEVMTSWLTLQERGEWIQEAFEKGKFPIRDMTWYEDLDFDYY